MKPDFDRSTALKILEAAFYRCAETDYPHGHIHNEEDVRASTYRHARAAFDLVPNWRLLTNLSAFGKRSKSKEHFKPDITLFHWSPNTPFPRVEIFAEIKHWPNETKMVSDLKKLTKLREIYTPERPDIAFFAILGHGFDHTSAAKLTKQLRRRFQAHIWLVPHWGPEGSLYVGPWNDAADLDPWRARLRHIHDTAKTKGRNA